LIIKPEDTGQIELPDGKVINIETSRYSGIDPVLVYRKLSLLTVKDPTKDQVLSLYYGNCLDTNSLYYWGERRLPYDINPFMNTVYCIYIPFMQGDLQTGLMWIEISHNKDDAVLRILRVNA